MPLLKQLLRIFNSLERWQLLGIFLLVVIGAALETFSVSAIPAFVALLSEPSLIQTQSWLQKAYLLSGASSSQDFMLWVSLSLLLIFLTKNLYLAFLARYQYYFLCRKQIALSSRLFNLYLKAPYTFHLQRNSAEISLTLTSEINKLFWNILVPLMTLISEMVVTTLLVCLLVAVEPISSLIAVTFLGGALFLFNRLARSFIRQQGEMRQFHDGQIYQWVNQGLGGIKETKVLGKEDFFVDTFFHHKTKSEDATVSLELVRQFSQLFIETIVIASVLLIVIVTLLQRRDISSVLPTLALFAIAALRIMPSAKRVASTTASIRFYKHVANLIISDLNALELHEAEWPKGKDFPLDPLQEVITLNHVSFKYPGADYDSVRNISLTISKGSSVAFVGPSGAGKSTLVDIILGLLLPVDGSICVDGQDIHQNLPHWQRQIGYIPQTIYLSDDTIRRNIAFGVIDSEIDDARVWSALKAAQLEKLVRELPARLDTLVGEQGVRLSGGQRQRVGIARAIYHNPQVLVMDEATAALDNATEREFMRALEQLSGEKTLIMIAHRLSTVKNCDRLYYIDRGQIADSGSYNELLAKNENFQAMAIQPNS